MWEGSTARMILKNVSLKVLLQKCMVLLSEWWLQAQEGGRETALKMMQYLGWKKPASCSPISSWWRDSTRTGPLLSIPGTFQPLLRGSRVAIRSYKTSGLLPAPQPCLPQSCLLFDFLLSQHFKIEKQVTAWPSAHGKAALGSLDPTPLSQGESHWMHLQEAGSYSF